MSGGDRQADLQTPTTLRIAHPPTDDGAFAALFERNEREVLAYCIRRTHNLADAEDATADVFAVAWRRRTDVPEPDSARPWLFAIARRILANQRRGNDRRGRLSLHLPLPPDEPERLGEASGAAVSALMRLRPDDQELLRLVAWEELDHGEIAQVLGISANAVAIRLHRARVRFERELRAAADPDELKEIADRRTSTRLKGKMLGLLRREPTK